MSDSKKAAVANYSEEMVSELVTAYKAVKTDSERKDVVENFADKFGKTVNSIRAKLSREKVYVKPAATTKNGGAIVRKSELVGQIAALLGEDPEVIESLEKATKPTLEKLIKALPKVE